MPEKERTRTHIDDGREKYLSCFGRFEQQIDGRSAGPIHRLRRRAIERFASLGFPTPRDEEWRYTRLSPLGRIDFSPLFESSTSPPAEADVSPFLFPGLESIQLVFVDGWYVPGLSSGGTDTSGLQVSNLARALEAAPDLVGAHLARYAGFEQAPFTALNTAFAQDGAFVYLPDETVLERPVHLLFFSTGREPPLFSSPRILIVTGQGCRASIVESYAGPESALYLTNAVTEIHVGPGSEIDYYEIQRESEEAFHFSDLGVRQDEGSSFRSTCITLGGRLTRNQVRTSLRGEGIEATLDGLYLTDGNRHADNHTQIEHVEPGCRSHELYKGILADGSSAVFRGRILVHQAAQRTDAYQTNRNLLLSADAQITSKPQLEIYADDVKCSHGTTVGQLDPEAVFYLRSRGIGSEEAGRLLVRAFAGEIVERIRIGPVRRRIDEILDEWLLPRTKELL